MSPDNRALLTPATPDEAFDEAALEAGRRLFTRECVFLKGVVAETGLPAGDRLEVAFAGRSNVGKSSLLNALTNRKSLARTSNTPGRTQEINYFSIGSELYLVDMPGYGYARTSRSRVNAWTALIRDYLRGRAALRRVFLLIDARHGIKKNDEEILDLLNTSAVATQVVLTKADKLKTDAREAIVADTRARLERHAAVLPDPLLTSSQKATGIPELRALIAGLG